jgi:hypothetical protein
VADFLDRLRALGVRQRTVRMERDAWILLQSVSPTEAAVWIADKRHLLDDPEFQAIYLEYDAAFDWSPDDPRLVALADRVHRWFAGRTGPVDSGEPPAANATIVRLLETALGASSPAWVRLAELARARQS